MFFFCPLHYLHRCMVKFLFFSPVRLRVPSGCTTELNSLGYQFLQRLFDKYDEVSPAVCVSFLSALWLFVHQHRLLSPRTWWWSIFCCRCRTKTRLCHPPNWKTSSACVPTCRGAPRSAPLSPPRNRATSLTSATAVSGRMCLTPHSYALVHHCRARVPHTVFYTGCLHILTSTAVWSTWGTWDTPSWLSRSHRPRPSQVCFYHIFFNTMTFVTLYENSCRLSLWVFVLYPYYKVVFFF